MCLAGFHSEELAVMDLLVLSRAEVFVGDVISTFSTYTRELRALQGIPKNTFYSIHKYDIDKEERVFVP